MKFVYKEKSEEDSLRFLQVGVNQFFVCYGRLYVKTDEYRAFALTNDMGQIHTAVESFSTGEIIEKILPEVEKIEY